MESHVFYCVFIVLFSLKLASACLDGNCRILAFPAPLFFDHKHLVNHTIRTEENVDFDICQLLCYHEDNCVSINYDLNTRRCELNNATHRGHDNEFVYKENSLYHGAESTCDKHCCDNGGTCQSGFTDKLYRCLCLFGFTGERCETDINECDAKTHNCSVNAICNNTKGSFNCTCKSGYTGDGHICTDIDECNAGSHDCLDKNYASCVNTNGSYNCVCNLGYVGDGRTKCEHAPECADYTILKTGDRKTTHETFTKDDNDLDKGWYRFDGAAGTRMADWCPPEQRCGAYLPGWLNGSHPSVDDGKVDRKVCFHYVPNCCRGQTQIKVRNCGDYYVYELDKTEKKYRYCGNG